jgi:light-regulated signal transduction histidine kinase (bacteriophytochrome)
MNNDKLLRYTRRREEILIRKENRLKALTDGSSREGLICSVSDAITFLLDDLRHNIFNIYLIYNSSLRTSSDAASTGERRDKRAYDLIKRINYQQHILIGLNEKLQKGQWCNPCPEGFTDINRNISNCVRQLRSNPGFPSGVTISLQLDEKIPAVRFQDCDLFQVIYHTVMSSIESSSEGRPPDLEIRTGMEGGELLIRISDKCSGTGLPPGEVTFADLVKLQTGSRKIRYGICACAKIIESYGGRMRIEQRYPEGSSVNILLAISDDQKGSSGSKGISQPPPASGYDK